MTVSPTGWFNVRTILRLFDSQNLTATLVLTKILKNKCTAIIVDET